MDNFMQIANETTLADQLNKNFTREQNEENIHMQIVNATLVDQHEVQSNENKPADSIYEIIARSKYGENPFDGLYIQNPIIGKESCWSPLGTKLSNNEKVCMNIIEPNKYFTIRADGKSFSKVVPHLQRLGILESGYSTCFENIMKTVAQEVTLKYQRVLFVFTQSDEITILFDKVDQHESSNVVFTHEFSGRKDKLMTLVSSLITYVFNREVFKLCGRFVFAKYDISEAQFKLNELLENLPDIIFDARVGTYDTLADAFELILWRAYDCSVNGVSQAIHFGTFVEHTKQELRKMNTYQKLEVLKEHGLLPLTNHQAYGTLLIKSFRPTEVTNKLTGETTTVNKRCYVEILGPVVHNFKQGLFTNML